MPQKLKRVIRLDSQPLNQTFFTSEGYLMDKPILTSTGIFEYLNPDGSVRRELRLPEEVFDPESLKSYRGKPIIVTHDAGLITKNNVADNAIGTILSEGYRSGDDVRAEIVIHDADELRNSGYRELSLGYNLDLDETPGIYKGERYDAIQRNIRINHLALVDEARAGDQARLNIDSRDKALKGGKLAVKKNKKKIVQRNDSKKHRNDSLLTPEELQVAIEEYKARRAEKANEDDISAEEMVALPLESETGEELGVIITAEPDEIEGQFELVKDRKDRRDEADAPETLAEAENVIAEQDKDLDILFNIIDTLLAQLAFDSEEETESNSVSEEVVENEDEDNEEVVEDKDEDDEEVVENEEDFIEDGDDEDIPCTEASEIPAGAVLNADSIDKLVRDRVKIAKAATLLNMDGLESVNPMKAKMTIIRAVKPGIRLDGKSKAYIQALFDLSCDEIQKASRKDTMYQRKQMFNKDSRAVGRNSGGSTEAARQKMIRRMQKSK